jgi:hypothetical protein
MTSLIVSDSYMDVDFEKSSDEFLSIVEYTLPMVFQSNPLVNNYILRTISNSGYVIDTDGKYNEPYIFIYDIIFTSIKDEYNRLFIDIINVLEGLYPLDFFSDERDFFNENFRNKYPNIVRLLEQFLVFCNPNEDLSSSYKKLSNYVNNERKKLNKK